jgi:hemerythrin-like domain-containing protein
MKATEILMEEHVVIERVLTALETALQRLEGGKTIRPGFFIESADFFKGFADGCHHKKEEDVLFPALTAHGLPKQGGPVQVMLTEHVQGRRFVAQMREAAQRWEAGEQPARQHVVSAATKYVELLRNHIFKENNVLFPMADQIVPPAEQHQITQDFERVEHEETGEGIHEKYLALTEKLENELEDGQLKL